MASAPTTGQQSRSHRQRYRLTEKLDVGGMAEIYRGKALSIGGIEREVAIKRILPSLTRNEKFVEMFLDEARLSMLLNHANIVQIFDVGRAGETYFLVMEYVHGHNLRRIFQRCAEVGQRIPLEIACYVAMEVCKGLAHAHEKTDEHGNHLHIVHRDLSPPNVLVSRSGEVKITDFGLSKAYTHVNVTDPGVVKGKYSYLSPEAAEGRDVDHRADIFSLGVGLWEMLANRRLFLGRTDVETVDMVRKAEIPSLAALNPRVDDAFERIVARALAREPRHRYTSARELEDALADYLFGHHLKVTAHQVQGFVQELFGEGPDGGADSEERIGGLIQEEILNLSMLGHLDPDQGTDGSQPVDAGTLSLRVQPQIDLSDFWARADIPGDPRGESQGSRRATMMALEAVRSPDQLADMLEGGGLEEERQRLKSEPDQEPVGRSGRWRWLVAGGAALVLLGAAAGVWFVLGPPF